uniref:CSON006681 protein n=1 Tax=Culicoides sonorensis TaxID=179676 RepID=A0A336LBV9_CULSO
MISIFESHKRPVKTNSGPGRFSDGCPHNFPLSICPCIRLYGYIRISSDHNQTSNKRKKEIKLKKKVKLNSESQRKNMTTRLKSQKQIII